jgi:hypothetical protein
VIRENVIESASVRNPSGDKDEVSINGNPRDLQYWLMGDTRQ